jgi:GDP-mannose 6-dehydrogenase
VSGDDVRVAVFGLGYVGTVTAACLAADGHHVVGVDINPGKVAMVNSGQSPVGEEGIGELLEEAVAAGRLHATDDATAAIQASDLAVVAVSTPSHNNGRLDTTHVEHVAKEIGSALADHDKFFVVGLRSTVLPGTTTGLFVPALEAASGRRAGVDFGVCMVPEFLREGVAVSDYYNPPKIVIGANDARSDQLMTLLFEGIDAPVVHTAIEMAEMVKYVDNAWHALKIGFANEVGRLGAALEMDSQRLMEIFKLDTKLNISDKYLTPGGPFGGSCLPKDVRALTYYGRQLDLNLPILNAVLPSNNRHIDHTFALVTKQESKRVGVLGLSFKSGTDDVRESPQVELIERLIGKGYDVRVFDPLVSLSALVGANREFLLTQIPHVSSLLLATIEEVIDHADTIVVATGDEAFQGVLDLKKPGQVVIDLVRVTADPDEVEGYHGICW